jgi:hypothetical protein
MFGAEARFWICPTPDTRHVRVSDTSTGIFLLEVIKAPPHPPLELDWPLSSLKYTLNQTFLNSKSLSLKLHFNPNFLREI